MEIMTCFQSTDVKRADFAFERKTDPSILWSWLWPPIIKSLFPALWVKNSNGRRQFQQSKDDFVYLAWFFVIQGKFFTCKIDWVIHPTAFLSYQINGKVCGIICLRINFLLWEWIISKFHFQYQILVVLFFFENLG